MRKRKAAVAWVTCAAALFHRRLRFVLPARPSRNRGTGLRPVRVRTGRRPVLRNPLHLIRSLLRLIGIVDAARSWSGRYAFVAGAGTRSAGGVIRTIAADRFGGRVLIIAFVSGLGSLLR